jgi:hypothetical protein
VPVCGNFARVLSARRVGISLRRRRQISGKVAQHSPTWRDTRGKLPFYVRARVAICVGFCLLRWTARIAKDGASLFALAPALFMQALGQCVALYSQRCGQRMLCSN